MDKNIHKFYSNINGMFYSELVKIKTRLDEMDFDSPTEFLKFFSDIIDEYDPNKQEEKVDNEIKCKRILSKGKNTGKNCGCKVYKDKEYCKKHLPKHCTYTGISGECTYNINIHSLNSNCTIHLLQELGPKCRYLKKYGNDGLMINQYTGYIFKDSKIWAKLAPTGDIVKDFVLSDIEIIKTYKFPISDEVKDKLLSLSK